MRISSESNPVKQAILFQQLRWFLGPELDFISILTKACSCIIRHVVAEVTQAFVRIVCTLDDTVGLWWAAVIEFLKTLFNFRAIMGAYIPPTRLTDAMVRTQWVLTRRLNRTGTRYLSTLVHIYGDLYDKLHYTRILIGSYLWPMEDRCLDDVTINVKCWVKGEITQVERSWIYLSQAWNNGKKIWSFN